MGCLDASRPDSASADTKSRDAVWSRQLTILVTEAIRAWDTLLPWETADLLRQQLDLGDVSVDETDNEHLKIRNTV